MLTETSRKRCVYKLYLLGWGDYKDPGPADCNPSRTTKRNQMTTIQNLASRATLRKKGSADYGYIIAQCDSPDCRDINGRPWQHAFSRRTVEGYTPAERDMNEHNNTRHSMAATA